MRARRSEARTDPGRPKRPHAATINGPADVTLSGSGDVDLYGDVALEHMSKTGSGAIRVH